MNDALDHGPEADDRPANVPATAPAAPRVTLVRARPSLSGRLFRWWLATCALLVLALGVCVAVGATQVDLSPVHVMIDGKDFSNISVDGLSDGGRALLFAGAVLLVLLMLVLIPLVVALVLSAVAIAVVCAIAVPLASVALAIAAITSPVWVVGLLIWRAGRRRSMPSATMAA